MPRKRTRTTTEYVDHEDEHESVPDADPAEESYAQFMAKWGREGAKVRVYRQTPQGKQYCFLGNPDEIDPESLRLFHAKQTYAHETGSYLIEVEVNGEVRSPFPILIAPQVNAPGVPESSGSGPMAEMFKMLQQQNERLERQLLTMQQTNREPIGNLADALLKIDQLRGTHAQQMSPEFMIKLIEMGRASGGEPDWTMKLLDVLKDSMPAVQGLISSFTQRNNGGGTVPIENEELILKQGLIYLKKKALGGSDPGLYIGIIADNYSEPLYEKLIRRILDNDFSAFAAIDADLTKPEYEPFFRAIYNGVRSVFTEPDPMALDSQRESGNISDIARDGKSRKSSSK